MPGIIALPNSSFLVEHTEAVSRMQMRALSILLTSYTNVKSGISYEMFSSTISSALFLLRSFKSDELEKSRKGMAGKEVSVIKGALVPCIQAGGQMISQYIETNPSVFGDFAAVANNFAYDAVCSPVLRLLVVALGTSTSSAITTFLEAASESDDERVVSRLVQLVIEETDKEGDITLLAEGLVHILAMLGSAKRAVRLGALDYLKMATTSPAFADSDNETCRAIQSLYNTALNPGMRPEIEMDGSSALPRLFVKVVKTSKQPDLIRSTLLEQCRAVLLKFSVNGWAAVLSVFTAMEFAGHEVFPLSQKWKLAGKELFEAITSAKNVEEHEKIIDFLEKYPSALLLVESIVRMLKGVKSNGSSTLAIISGPSNRRSRSYSVGTDEELFLYPYPLEMKESVCACLSATMPIRIVQETLMQTVLSSPSWSKHVYPKLDVETRNTIIRGLMLLHVLGGSAIAKHSLLGITASQEELFTLLNDITSDVIDMSDDLEEETSSNKLQAMTLIAECVGVRSASFPPQNDTVFALTKLFVDNLSVLSAPSFQADGSEYTRVCILKTLLTLVNEIHIETAGKVATPSPRRKSRKKVTKADSNEGEKQKLFASLADLLVDLLAGKVSSTESNVRPLVSTRSKEIAVEALTIMCTKASKIVIPRIVKAVAQVVSFSSTVKQDPNLTVTKYKGKAMKEALEAIIPAYCSNAHLAKFTFSDLLRSVLSQSVGEDTNKLEIYGHFVSALSSIPNSSAGVSSLIASLLANAAFCSSPSTSGDNSMDVDDDGTEYRGGDDVTFVLNLMQQVPCMISTTSFLLQYISKILFNLSGNEESSDQMDFESTDISISLVVPCNELMGISVNGPSEKTEIDENKHNEQARRSLMLFTTNLITLVRNGLMNPDVGRLMKSRDEKYAKLCLNLWQELMQLHADALSCRSEILQLANSEVEREISDLELAFWDAAPSATQDCVDRVQRLLPTPHFLVSITSLLQEKDGDVALQRRALRLLGERASEIDPLPSAKASLFLEIVPDLTNLLGGNISSKNGAGTDQENSQQARRNIVLQQAVLMAIEQLAGHLCGESSSSEEVSVFIPSVSKVCTLMIDATNQTCNDSDEDATRRLLSSAALAAATLISILKVRCLPFLPKIIRPLLSALSSVNKSTVKDDLDKLSNDYAAINILRRAVVRCFVAIVETLPQFLGPYLGAILSPGTLLSQSIRESAGSDSSMAALLKRFDEGLATKVPIRLLLPEASEVVTRCLDEDGVEGTVYWRETIAVLGIITISIRSCSRADLSSIIVKVIGVAMSSFGYSKLDGRFELLDAANKALLSLVMKMSEAQLRSLYSRLREWRGDLVKDEDDNGSSIRRFAFWSMTSVLCKELRGIFLPCMSSVLTDIVQELVGGCSLCT